MGVGRSGVLAARRLTAELELKGSRLSYPCRPLGVEEPPCLLLPGFHPDGLLVYEFPDTKGKGLTHSK
jgi:hypothetical protein